MTSAMVVPHVSLLVFDGSCGFCERSAGWVERRLPAGAEVAVEPWQGLDLSALGLSGEEVADAAWWIDAAGTRCRGHLAIAAALRTIGGAWGVVGRMLTWPVLSQVARASYRVVAEHRDRLPGSTSPCRRRRP